MAIWKPITAACALVLTLALLSLSQLHAATLLGPGSQPGALPLTTSVAMSKEHKTHKMMRHHRKHHHRHHKGKRMHSKGPGRCGANMYFSKKHGRCMDARLK
jgi:hypothetical protein